MNRSISVFCTDETVWLAALRMVQNKQVIRVKKQGATALVPNYLQILWFISATMVSGLGRGFILQFVFFAFAAILKKICHIVAVSAMVLRHYFFNLLHTVVV